MKYIKLDFTVDAQLRFPADLRFNINQGSEKLTEKTIRVESPNSYSVVAEYADQYTHDNITIDVLQGGTWVPMNEVLQKVGLPDLLGWAVFFNGYKIGVK